jgi:hypothetical protein
LDFNGWNVEFAASSFDAHKYNRIPQCFNAIFQVPKCHFVMSQIPSAHQVPSPIIIVAAANSVANPIAYVVACYKSDLQ